MLTPPPPPRFSLHDLMYEIEALSENGFVRVVPSRFWRFVRLEAAGREIFRSIVYQLLEALAAVHARGVVHRDVKPENLLVQFTDEGVQVRLCDFGSAVSNDMPANLYRHTGVENRATITVEYAPPEALFGQEREYHFSPAFGNFFFF